MASLKSNDPVVVDTHVLVLACTQQREGKSGVELNFVNTLLDRCPRIFLSPKQVNREKGSGELLTKLRQELRHFDFPPMSAHGPWSIPLLVALDNGKKLKRAEQSSLPTFADYQRALFRGEKHMNITDDEHLYRTAVGKHASVVVTNDQWLHQQARALYSQLGVDTLYPLDAIAQMTP